MWHYRRRRQPEPGYMDPETVTGNTQRHTTGASGSIGQSRPNEEANPQAPSAASGGTLSGPLQQLSHTQWEQANDASPVDNNPLVASMSSGAAREALTSFGAGASAGMVQALATWIASHVRVRRATRAPNHWCWSTTIVCWLIARAICHNGRERGLSARSLATRFDTYERGRHATKTHSILRARYPQAHRVSASMGAWSRTPTQESLKSQLHILTGWCRPYGRKPAKRSREAKRTEMTLRPLALTCK